MKETKILNGEEFIQEYLIKRVGELREKFQFFAFTIIAVGIETLGAFLDNEPFDSRKHGISSTRFKAAIDHLFDVKYQLSATRLYSSLRCGLAHTTKPKPDIYLCGSGYDHRHLQEDNGILILALDQFYNDYVAAAQKLLGLIRANDPAIDHAKLSNLMTETIEVTQDTVTGKLLEHGTTGDFTSPIPAP